MPILVLATLLWGTVAVQTPLPSPQVHVATVPPRAAESDAARVQRLRLLVEGAEKALEEDDETATEAWSDEADVLTADWSTDLLKQPEVQELLQRLKDVQDQMVGEGTTDSEPGLKAPDEVVSISGGALEAELERVHSAEQGVNYDFPIDLNDKVATWVSLFSTTKHGFIENALGRASMYLPMIRQVFAEERVPSDLAYLAVIESGFRNEAKSRAKAVGMWQFIRSTGRIYGLTANAWLEERRDPVKATRAAARYLRRLYEITGDWYLAASSYNAGPLTLERAIQNVGTRNFWDLARSRWLRTETKNYVPELCAAILIGRDPERYGLRVVPLMPYAYETVAVTSMTSLTVLARCAGTDAGTLKALNPELLRGSTPPGSYQLRVPPGRALDCLRQLASMPAGKRLDFSGYTVRKGDTLAKVAKRFKLTPEDLLAANDITAKQFKPGKRLLVPPPPALALEARDLASPGSGAALGDRPLPSLPELPRDPGDLPEAAGPEHQSPEPTAVGLAAPATRVRTSAPPVEVPDMNEGGPPGRFAPSTSPLVLPHVVAGQSPATTSVRKPQQQSSPFRVIKARPGDTLAKLARTRRVPLRELLRLNPGAAQALHPGEEVRLPGIAHAARATTATVSSHRVQKGESLALIARKHGLAPKDLKAWNHLKSDRIQAGQKLRLTAP